MVQCPECQQFRRRFKCRSWFMRHMEKLHGFSSLAALQAWFDACGQTNFDKFLTVN